RPACAQGGASPVARRRAPASWPEGCRAFPPGGGGGAAGEPRPPGRGETRKNGKRRGRPGPPPGPRAAPPPPSPPPPAPRAERTLRRLVDGVGPAGRPVDQLRGVDGDDRSLDLEREAL